MSKRQGNIIAIFSGLFWKRLWAECRALAASMQSQNSHQESSQSSIQAEERQRLLDDSLTIMDEILASKEQRGSADYTLHDSIHTVLAQRLLETKETR
jgi:hypothetical protein